MRKQWLLGATAGALALMAGTSARADFNPVPLTPGSFTYDIVVEKTAPPPLGNFTTATMDGATNNDSWVWYEKGYNVGQPWTGVPPHGSVFSAVGDANHQFRMPADYSVNNTLCLYSNWNSSGSYTIGLPTGSLRLTTPTALATLSFLAASGGGSSTVDYTVHHSGGADETGTLSINDWFNSVANVAAYVEGRFDMNSGTFGALGPEGGSSAPSMFYYDLTLTDQVNPVTSIDFATTSGSRAVFFAVSGVLPSASTFSPLAVTGFNRDMIVEVGAPAPSVLFSAVNATLEYPVGLHGNCFFEQGLLRDSPTTLTYGLPHPGTTFTNSAGNHAFTMAPSYTANDAVLIDQNKSGTLNLSPSSQAAYTALSLLTCSTWGPINLYVTVWHADGTPESFTVSSPDWTAGGTPAFNPNGTFSVENSGFNNAGVSGNHGVLWAADFSLTAGSSSPVTRIEISYNGDVSSPDHHAFVMAVAGKTAASGVFFAPVLFSGYNADVVVEKEQTLWFPPHTPGSWPAGLFTATTASMDNGTNNFAWTWYEQGYWTNAPTTGLPAAGSTLNSASNPNRHYTMPARYDAPNAVLIDTNHQVASITPQTPDTFTSLSLLTAGASIGGANVMSNLCVLQYADGTTETNMFYGYDWFNSAAPPAFIANGRVNLNSRAIGNQYGGFPRLFETQFVLNNTATPVTNLLVMYKTAGGATWTTYVMAVSGSKDPVAPAFDFPATPTLTIMEGTNITLTATARGTPTITYQWQYSANGTTWVNLSDVGTLSGATTSSLNISSVGITNAGQYRVVASNPVGNSTNVPGTLTVYSGYPDVTVPGDPLTVFGGTGTMDGGPAAFINNNVGNKCLISGLPTSNPVNCGFIVTPSMDSTIVRGLRLYTANDAQGRDPTSVVLEGSNDGGNTWNVILPQTTLNLPAGRNGTATAVPNPLTQYVQEIDFYSNNAGYLMYRVTFPTINSPSGGLMQLAEAELLGTQNLIGPTITRQPAVTVTTYVGGAPTFGVAATGPKPLSYQWYQGTTAIPNATNSSYTLFNAQLSDSGKTFSCKVSNPYNSVTSASGTLSIINVPYTQAYPLAVLADHPIAFWRLDEADNGLGNNGLPVNDYLGGHNGQYTNAVLGVAGYNPLIDADKAATFGLLATADSYAGNMQDISFEAPTNTSMAFSVEAWVNGSAQTATDPGLVTKGAGGGGEQFNLDVGGNNHTTFRFFVRDANGGTHGSAGTKGPDGKWHHVVGVCDEANSNIVLYVDGIQNAISSGFASGLGILKSTAPVSIGARRSGANTAHDLQFNGTIDDVAIYNTALSSNRVLAHYYAANPPPVFSLQPTNTTVAEGTIATLYSSAYGPGTLSYQWYQSADSGVSYTQMASMTSSNLVLPNVPSSYSTYQYEVVAANAFGSVTSTPATLTVVGGPPSISLDLPLTAVVYAGRTAVLRVEVGGTAPFTYTWTSNGVTIVNGGRISGATSNVLTIANTQLGDTATYQVQVSNAQGGPVYSTAEALTVTARPSFANNGTGWSLNGGATFTADVLGLTEAVNSQARSSFFPEPLYIGNFAASFIYQDVTGGGADGFSFCLQNDPRGAAALGGAGGALGLSGIIPSAAVTFNIYGTPGIAFGLDGNNGSPYAAIDPVDITSTDPIFVAIRYANGVVAVTLTDSNTIPVRSFSTNFVVGDLPTLLGADTAYVGFTAATGGLNAQQQVSNFAFVPYPILSAQRTSGGAVLLSWPAAIGGFGVLQKADLSAGAWSAVPAQPTLVGDQYQVVVSAPGSSGFYRLVLP